MTALLWWSLLSWAWGSGPTRSPLTLEAYFEAAQHPFTASHFQAIFGEGRHSERSNPGFAGAYRGLLARDGRSPLSRLENARAASALLNQAVRQGESDPRWRLLRLTLEAQMPGWLGLSSHVPEDRAFLNRLLSKKNQEGILQTVPNSSEDWPKFYQKMK